MKKFVDWYYGWFYRCPNLCSYITSFVFVAVSVLFIVFLFSYFQLTGIVSYVSGICLSFVGVVTSLILTATLHKRAFKKTVRKNVYNALSSLAKED